MSINFAVRSETGHVRENNEDNFYCNNGIFMTPQEREKPFFMRGIAENPSIFAVFDGMGGEDCGELASLTAIETLAEHSDKILYGSYVELNDFVSDVNKRLNSLMQERNIVTGTTFVLVVVKDDSFTVYNLGDSRAYRLWNGILIRITADHTVAEDKVRLGILTPRRAEKSRERNILTGYLGMSDYKATMPDVNGPYYFNENKRVLLCSDGLTDMLSHREIAAIMTEAEDSSKAVNSLVDTALNKGGKDNITCIVIDCIT